MLKMLISKHFWSFSKIILLLQICTFSICNAKSLQRTTEELHSFNCGDPNFKESWIVTIENEDGTNCKGVLISDRHIIAASVCGRSRDSGKSGSEPRLTFTNNSASVVIEKRADYKELLSVLTVNPAFDFSSPEVGLRPVCLPKSSSSEYEKKCLQQPQEEKLDSVFCKVSKCEAKASPTGVTYTKDQGFLYLSGISRGVCPTESETPYINVYSLLDWIKHQLNPNQRKNDLNSLSSKVPRQLDKAGSQPSILNSSTSAELTRVFERICPIMIESELRIPICEGRRRSVDGIVRINANKDCPEMEVIGNKVVCKTNPKTELDIICTVLPLNKTLITLVDAQNLCGQNLKDIENEKAGEVADENEATTEKSDTENEETVNRAAFHSASELAQSDFTVTAEAPKNLTEPAASSTASLKSCRTQKPNQFCQFPFWFENRLRFECVRRLGAMKCPTIVDPKTLEGENFIACEESCPLMKYHNHPELIDDLDLIEKTFPENVRTFSVGSSSKGYDMKGVRISLGLQQFHGDSTIELRPMVKLVGNMHGNEPTGRELIIQLAKYLNGAAELQKSPYYRSFSKELKEDVDRAAKILETTDLWILPTMNPDGFARAKEGECYGGRYTDGRQNEGKQDLNRNFPNYYDKVKLDSDRQKNSDFLYEKREHETKLMMKWILQHPFVLSANFHDGAVLANYPYDDYHGRENNKTGPNNTPDHDVFIHLARTYTHNHATMNNATENCEQWGPFLEGITNGADWYEVIGGMQDFNYLFTNAMELTLELSCCKYANRDRLLVEWDNNFNSLLAYIEQAQRGIKGTVVDSNNNPVRNARIRINKHGEDGSNWRSKDILTSADGKYWRLLVPGSYNVQAVDANNSTSAVDEVKIDDVLEPIILDLMIKTNTREVIKAGERLPVQSEFPQKSSRDFLRRQFRGR